MLIGFVALADACLMQDACQRQTVESKGEIFE